MPVIGGDTPPAVGAAVLAVVLLVGVVAGRGRRRWSLLLAGLVAVVVLGVAVTATMGTPGADRATEIAALYAVALPLVVTFGAGWLCGRGTWFRRLIVIAVAVLFLAAFPYAAAGQVTADTLLGRAGPG